MRTMDGDFHPEGKIPDGCLSSFSSLLYFLFIPHLLCSPLVLCCTGFFSPSPVFLLRAGALTPTPDSCTLSF